MRELGRPVLAAAAVVICGAVMTILDSTIVNVAIERLAVAFDSRLSTIQWVSTAYLLALAAAIPLAGWAVDRFGTRKVFMSAVTAFACGSLLCGLAWSAGSLIAFRVVQGLGGGMVMPVGMTILARAAGQDRMGRVMALVGVPMLLAPALGPILGGALLDGASWRLIFFINLPVAALALVLAARVLPREPGSPARAARRARLRAALARPRRARRRAASPPAAPSPTPLAGARLRAARRLRVHALRTEHPLIDLRIFQDRVVAAATATTLLFGAAFFGSLLLLALYYQLARDFSALNTGLVLAAQGVGAMLTMPVAGKLTDRNGAGLGGPRRARAGDRRDDPVRVRRRRRAELAARRRALPARRGHGRDADAGDGRGLPGGAPEAMARAASAMEIVQRVGATFGIALLAVILQHGLTTRVPGFEGTLSTVEDASPAVRAALSEPLTEAAGQTFVWALVLTALTLIPALMLPRRARALAPVAAIADAGS